MRITGQERGWGENPGPGEARRPSPAREGDFPGLERRCEVRSAGGIRSRDPGRARKRPRLGRAPPEGANKTAETKVLPARRLDLVLPKARVNSRRSSAVPPGRVNRTSRGAAAAPPIGCVRCVLRSRPREGAGLVMRPRRLLCGLQLQRRKGRAWEVGFRREGGANGGGSG